jgi:hypothetical protein
MSVRATTRLEGDGSKMVACVGGAPEPGRAERWGLAVGLGWVVAEQLDCAQGRAATCPVE